MKLDPQGCKAAEAALQEMHFDSYGMIDEIAEAAITAYLAAARPAVTVGNIVSQIAIWSDDEGLDLSYGQGDDLARRILSALSAHLCTTYPSAPLSTPPHKEPAMTSDAEIRALIDRLTGVYRVPIKDGLGAVGAGEEPDNPNEFVRKFETPPIQHEAAAVLSALLEERGGCDPDGCKGHIDAFMRRAEAAEAERDAMAVQLAYANVAQEQEG